MSKFTNKIIAGETPEADDLSDHLVEAHRRFPGSTPLSFASLRGADGRNSYERLSESASSITGQAPTIVDLACGDGYQLRSLLPRLGPRAKVVGIDMVDAQIELAKQNWSNPRVSFVLARSDAMPLADQSADLILCHLSFMLMRPLEKSAAEIARVLKPNAVFSAVVHRPGDFTGLHADAMALASKFVFDRYPGMRNAQFNDPRAFSLDGMRAIFTPSLRILDDIGIEDFEVVGKLSPDEHWSLLSKLYLFSWLPTAELAALESEFRSWAVERADREGKLEIRFPLRTWIVKKGV